MQVRPLNLLVLLLPVVLWGCATPGAVNVKGLRYPLAYIQSTVSDHLPLGKRKVSPNGREFYSNYFLVKGHKAISATHQFYRMYAKVTVLGDSRPYTLQAVVYRERRLSQTTLQSQYKTIGTDKRLATAVLKRIQRALTKRRGDLNVIDDFRVF